MPEPAVFLLLAAVASDVFPELGERLSIQEVERIGVVALIVILFNGGTLIGWRRFGVVAVPVFALGVIGTFATAGMIAVAAHYLFDFLLGHRRHRRRSPRPHRSRRHVLGARQQGDRRPHGHDPGRESGVNDPVGIALMIGMIELAQDADATFWVVVEEFVLEMSIGLAVGLLAAAAQAFTRFAP